MLKGFTHIYELHYEIEISKSLISVTNALITLT